MVNPRLLFFTATGNCWCYRAWHRPQPSKLPEVVTLLAFIRELSGLNLGFNTDHPVWNLCALSQFFQAKVRIVSAVRPRPLPFPSFPTHYKNKQKEIFHSLFSLRINGLVTTNCASFTVLTPNLPHVFVTWEIHSYLLGEIWCCPLLIGHWNVVKGKLRQWVGGFRRFDKTFRPDLQESTREYENSTLPEIRNVIIQWRNFTQKVTRHCLESDRWKYQGCGFFSCLMFCVLNSQASLAEHHVSSTWKTNGIEQVCKVTCSRYTRKISLCRL